MDYLKRYKVDNTKRKNFHREMSMINKRNKRFQSLIIIGISINPGLDLNQYKIILA